MTRTALRASCNRWRSLANRLNARTRSGLVSPMRTAFVLALVACGSNHGAPAEPDAPAGVSTTDASSSDAPMTTGGACAGRVAQPLDSTWTVMVNGVARTANVHVPASYDPTKPTPVVLNIHGLTSTADQQAQISHAIAKSDSAGFVVVHPQADTSPITSWNAGTCCDPASSSNNDDMGFMTALLDQLDATLCVDDSRVFAMGLSNGAYMSYRLACELDDRIAAVGPVAGSLVYSPCTPTRPMPLFAVHGDADPLVMYSYDVTSTDEWSQANGCTTSMQTYQNGDATCVTHSGCNAGADVVFCTISGGGHQWPGGDALPLLGKKSDDLIATDAIWDFFVAHPKP